MKILFVCQQYIHAARWINQLKDTAHQIYVFDCLDRPIHQDLLWTNYTTNWSKRKIPYLKGEHFLQKKTPKLYEKIAPFLKVTPSDRLVALIKEIQPDLVHSLEMQSQTYHVLKAKQQFNFKWAYFCWGNDLYMFKDNDKHKKKINEVLKNIDFLFTDTHRDIILAKNNGFNKEQVNVFPGGGGYEIIKYKKFILPLFIRKTIIIKGYEHNYGRAITVLNAIDKIADTIKKFDIYVYSAHQIVVDKIKEINKKHHLNIQYSTRDQEISHKELLAKFGSAKIAIGNSISDGIPNTLLEAIILGAFPIQSNPGGATEDYIVDGGNGFLIENPEDASEIADKISKALKNDELLEKVFIINQEKAKKLDYKVIQKLVIEVYHNIEKSL